LKKDNEVIIGGIIKHQNKKVGFKLSFPNKAKAQYYKEMFKWIIKSDCFEVLDHNGYYDKNNQDGEN